MLFLDPYKLGPPTTSLRLAIALDIQPCYLLASQNPAHVNLAPRGGSHICNSSWRRSRCMRMDRNFGVQGPVLTNPRVTDNRGVMSSGALRVMRMQHRWLRDHRMHREASAALLPQELHEDRDEGFQNFKMSLIMTSLLISSIAITSFHLFLTHVARSSLLTQCPHRASPNPRRIRQHRCHRISVPHEFRIFWILQVSCFYIFHVFILYGFTVALLLLLLLLLLLYIYIHIYIYIYIAGIAGFSTPPLPLKPQ